METFPVVLTKYFSQYLKKKEERILIKYCIYLDNSYTVMLCALGIYLAFMVKSFYWKILPYFPIVKKQIKCC